MGKPFGHGIAYAVVAIVLATPAVTHGYEFEVRAQTVGQGLQLRVFRPLTGNIRVDRRRFTQWLNLSIWNVGDQRNRRWSRYEKRRSGPKLSVQSSLRIDHDFADWTSGSVDTGSRISDAIDLVPELEAAAVSLDILTLYVAAEELLGDRVDVYAGRQLGVGALEWWSFDGVSVRYRTPYPVAVEAFGGIRVRDSSFLASNTTELDGTGSAQCREYVEAATAGSGAWRPIDVGVPSNTAFRNDFDVCPQREELQPTMGGAVVLEGLGWLFGRLSYRRTMSPSPGLIGPADRFTEPDTGFYPNEDGQRPKWAVNEEKVTASLRANLDPAGGTFRVLPYAAVRYSALHGLIDEAHIGARLGARSHALEPEVFYSYPTFDGDSIFNIFSTQPYWDLRATYSWSSARALALYVRPWARRFSVEDAGRAAAGEDVSPSDWAGGVHAGTRLRLRTRDSLRVDGFVEDGYGGKRIGGAFAGRWYATRALGFATRLSLIQFADALLADLDGINLGAQLGTTYQIFEGVGLKALGEYNHNRFNDHQVRVFAILDLAFRPEL